MFNDIFLTIYADSSYLSNGYLDTTVDCIPSLNNIRLRDFPVVIRTTDINDPMLNFSMGETERISKASAIIFNTFDALESEILDALSPLCPPVYGIGPVHMLVNRLQENSLKFMGGNLHYSSTSLNCQRERAKHFSSFFFFCQILFNARIYVQVGSITFLLRFNQCFKRHNML